MTCDDARSTLREYQEGRLPPPRQGEVRAHLQGCAACAHADLVERELTALLERGLAQYPASLALKRRLARQWPAPTAPRARWSGWRPHLVPALALAALALGLGSVAHLARTADRDTTVMVREAVNDHLRLVSSRHPLDVESGGLHQVKPWFAGRVDFAPVVAFEGDAEFPLQGGATGYFLDRKAAVLVYAHRLHTISLVVFRADGLWWPAGEAVTAEERGVTVVLWRHATLGYALVSDVDRRVLAALAAKLRPPP
jgi:anti-sigma factor RsiW